MIEHVSDRSKRINKIEFTRGDRVVAVRWLHRFAGDTTRLTFVKDSYDNERDYDGVNSTELRAVGFQMKQVKIPVAPGASKTRSAVARERGRAVPHEADIHFVLDKDTEDGIRISTCRIGNCKQFCKHQWHIRECNSIEYDDVGTYCMCGHCDQCASALAQRMRVWPGCARA